MCPPEPHPSTLPGTPPTSLCLHHIFRAQLKLRQLIERAHSHLICPMNDRWIDESIDRTVDRFHMVLPWNLSYVVTFFFLVLFCSVLLSFAFHMKCNKPSLILFLFVSFIYSPGCGRERERRRRGPKVVGVGGYWGSVEVGGCSTCCCCCHALSATWIAVQQGFLSRNVLLISTETGRVWGGVRWDKVRWGWVEFTWGDSGYCSLSMVGFIAMQSCSRTVKIDVNWSFV